jgi:hypothetical protein
LSQHGSNMDRCSGLPNLKVLCALIYNQPFIETSSDGARESWPKNHASASAGTHQGKVYMRTTNATTVTTATTTTCVGVGEGRDGRVGSCGQEIADTQTVPGPCSGEPRGEHRVIYSHSQRAASGCRLSARSTKARERNQPGVLGAARLFRRIAVRRDPQTRCHASRELSEGKFLITSAMLLRS